mmetsp:Transcript_5442/g.9187  ORF Transcript_5442/g.9187 Transcript_5442/m.9187 type:complete len:110 (+) Transcript_5442:994-1323(+)
MCFPFLFRATLDTRSTQINEKMKMAAATALAKMVREPVPEEVRKVYSDRSFEFGREYVIPTPFDPRLIAEIPLRVAEAAMESGVAQMPIKDLDKYVEELKLIGQQNAKL